MGSAESQVPTTLPSCFPVNSDHANTAPVFRCIFKRVYRLLGPCFKNTSTIIRICLLFRLARECFPVCHVSGSCLVNKFPVLSFCHTHSCQSIIILSTYSLKFVVLIFDHFTMFRMSSFFLTEGKTHKK